MVTLRKRKVAMPHAYTENQLVEQPAKVSGPPSPWPSPSGRGNDGLFAELCWAVAGPPPNAGVAGDLDIR